MKTTRPELWQDRTSFAPTRGRVIDHLAFSVDDLDSTLTRLRSEGVKMTTEPRELARGETRSAFIEGPDGVAIELIEDRSPRPAPLE